MMAHLERIPALVAAVAVTVYWGAVLVKLVRLGRKLGKDPNALPRERVGQLVGRLEIRTGASGTTVIAVLPAAEETS